MTARVGKRMNCLSTASLCLGIQWRQVALAISGADYGKGFFGEDGYPTAWLRSFP